MGLSPRLRGNAFGSDCGRDSPGSIPALAGERLTAVRAALIGGVYPRACGGTGGIDIWSRRGKGLSPRLRGNAGLPRDGLVPLWSIPALAGERRHSRRSDAQIKVYPRACGGTANFGNRCRSVKGLSPRLRGNDWDDRHGSRRAGSIPALAGERRILALGTWWSGVYPRACGGTRNVIVSHRSAGGLSPRLRGNASDSWRPRMCAGSIPALAGERCDTFL